MIYRTRRFHEYHVAKKGRFCFWGGVVAECQICFEAGALMYNLYT